MQNKTIEKMSKNTIESNEQKKARRKWQRIRCEIDILLLKNEFDETQQLHTQIKKKKTNSLKIFAICWIEPSVQMMSQPRSTAVVVVAAVSVVIIFSFLNYSESPFRCRFLHLWFEFEFVVYFCLILCHQAKVKLIPLWFTLLLDLRVFISIDFGDFDLYLYYFLLRALDLRDVVGLPTRLCALVRRLGFSRILSNWQMIQSNFGPNNTKGTKIKLAISLFN